MNNTQIIDLKKYEDYAEAEKAAKKLVVRHKTDIQIMEIVAQAEVPTGHVTMTKAV